MYGLLGDASLNLRLGHIYFTLIEHFGLSMVLFGKVDFLNQYNLFSNDSGLFIPTGTNYILTSLGEMIYSAGLFALLLLIMLLIKAKNTCVTFVAAIMKISFIMACMLNPISISNIFLVMYICKREKR